MLLNLGSFLLAILVTASYIVEHLPLFALLGGGGLVVIFLLADHYHAKSVKSYIALPPAAFSC